MDTGLIAQLKEGALGAEHAIEERDNRIVELQKSLEARELSGRGDEQLRENLARVEGELAEAKAKV